VSRNDRVWIHYHNAGSNSSAGAIHVFSAAGQMFHLHSSDFFHLRYFAGFSAVFIHQYLTLRTRKSLALFIATLMTVGVLQMLVAQPAAPITDVQTWRATQ
jgi:hypothetical protein